MRADVQLSVEVLKKYAVPSESAAALKKPAKGCYLSCIDDLKPTRLQIVQTKLATAAGYVPPEKLPPTSDAARSHSHRVFLQVQAWKGNGLSPEEWPDRRDPQ